MTDDQAPTTDDGAGGGEVGVGTDGEPELCTSGEEGVK